MRLAPPSPLAGVLRRWLLGSALAAAWAFGLGAPVVRADGPPPAAAAQKAALAALDRALERFAGLLARDDDAAHRAATQAALDGFRARRDALAGAFDSSQCDDLRAELGLAYQRLAAWIGAGPSGR